MTPHTIPQTVLFPDLFDKPLVATFNQEHASSDGGGVLLKAAERVYGLVKAFAGCLADKRAPGKIRHTLADLIGQRVFGIACGHPDGNDADHLADDPIHKLLLGRDPVSGAPLASQPTISRFENGARRTVLYRMGRELAACVIERHRRRLQGRARRITIDLDPTDELTHGAQQLTFFNGHYGGWCYLPLLGFLSFDREAEQYLCAAVLRPGKAVAADGTLGLLCRLLPLLRAAFPRARFLVRLDGGFATPEIFDFLDAEPRLDYVVAMAKNAVLQRHAESAMQVARAQSEVGGETAHVYTDTRYAARTWDHERRVVIKAEVVRLGDREPRDNPRFVVTNLRQTPRFIYEKVYCPVIHGQWDPPDIPTSCYIRYQFYNTQRSVSGQIAAECGGSSDNYHSAPFGNWGVNSNYGSLRDGYQFPGWKYSDTWYQWNSCTTNGIPAPHRHRIAHPPRITPTTIIAVTPTNSAMHRSRIGLNRSAVDGGSTRRH